MSIELTENTLGIWYVTIPNGDYLASVSKKDDGKADLQYRFRYYNSLDPWDEKDIKNWYRGSGLDVKEAIDAVARTAKTLSEISGGEFWELIRGTGTLDQYIAEFQKLPFVHSRSEVVTA